MCLQTQGGQGVVFACKRCKVGIRVGEYLSGSWARRKHDSGLLWPLGFRDVQGSGTWLGDFADYASNICLHRDRIKGLGLRLVMFRRTA